MVLVIDNGLDGIRELIAEARDRSQHSLDRNPNRRRERDRLTGEIGMANTLLAYLGTAVLVDKPERTTELPPKPSFADGTLAAGLADASLKALELSATFAQLATRAAVEQANPLLAVSSKRPDFWYEPGDRPLADVGTVGEGRRHQ